MTDREREVFGLVARGLTRAETAQSPRISEEIVRTHAVDILTELRLRDRVQAVILAYEIGLIQPGERQG